jgi:hypothetical protein
MEDWNELEASVFAQVVEALPPAAPRQGLGPTTHLRRDLGLDSLGLASFLFRCGDGLGVDQDELIEVLTASPVHTLGDTVATFARLVASAHGVA